MFDAARSTSRRGVTLTCRGLSASTASPAAARAWRRLAESLDSATSASGLDLLGHGSSPWEPPWGIDEHLDLLVASVGTQTAVWIGHSYGGSFAPSWRPADPTWSSGSSSSTRGPARSCRCAPRGRDGTEDRYPRRDDGSGRRDSNPRPSPWQGDALPTEPLPPGTRAHP